MPPRLSTVAAAYAAASVLMFGVVGCPLDDADTGLEPADTPLTPGLHTRALHVNERQRHYSIYVPEGDAVSTRPLVLILHGSGATGREDLENNGWRAKAEQAGFIALAPDALALEPDLPGNLLTNPPLWNAGQTYATQTIDDVAFIDALLSHVGAEVSIDASRTFVVGFSGGGSMAFRLAAERSSLFAAAAVCAGPLWVDDPAPALRVPTLFIVGAADPLVPLAGGRQDFFWLDRATPPVNDMLARWAAAMRCESRYTVVDNDGAVLTATFGDCDDDTPMQALFIAAHGHHWPGGRPVHPELLFGPRASALDATDRIWQFLETARPREP